LPGGRIEVATPGLVPGQSVQVLVTPNRSSDKHSDTFLAFLQALPSKRSAEEWKQFEADFQAERDAWQR
jgi:hypothetical protein